MKSYKTFYLFFLCLISFFFPLAAKAYAGPGVAIGAIIVAVTVLLAFITSTIIGFINFLKKTKNNFKSKKKKSMISNKK